MIDQYSSSYPIAGAAEAVGISRALAYGYVWANRQFAGNPTQETYDALFSAWTAIWEAHGQPTACAFQERVEAAIMDGRVYWPHKAWFLGAPLAPTRAVEVIREDDDDGDDMSIIAANGVNLE